MPGINTCPYVFINIQMPDPMFSYIKSLLSYSLMDRNSDAMQKTSENAKIHATKYSDAQTP